MDESCVDNAVSDKDDPDFEITIKKRGVGRKKRKSTNDAKEAGKKLKKDAQSLNSPILSTKSEEKAELSSSRNKKLEKSSSKIRTLDQMFASMRKQASPATQTEKPEPSSPVRAQQVEIIDLISPEPPKKIKLIKEVTKNENSPKLSTAIKKKAEFRKTKLRIELKRREKRRKMLASIPKKSDTILVDGQANGLDEDPQSGTPKKSDDAIVPQSENGISPSSRTACSSPVEEKKGHKTRRLRTRKIAETPVKFVATKTLEHRRNSSAKLGVKSDQPPVNDETIDITSENDSQGDIEESSPKRRRKSSAKLDVKPGPPVKSKIIDITGENNSQGDIEGSSPKRRRKSSAKLDVKPGPPVKSKIIDITGENNSQGDIEGSSPKRRRKSSAKLDVKPGPPVKSKIIDITGENNSQGDIGKRKEIPLNELFLPKETKKKITIDENVFNGSKTSNTNSSKVTKKSKNLKNKEIHPLMVTKLKKTNHLKDNSITLFRKQNPITRLGGKTLISVKKHKTMASTKKRDKEIKKANCLSTQVAKDSKKGARQPLKPRKSSSDSVVCVGEVKKPAEITYSNIMKQNIFEKRKENYGLSALPCETILWTEKYEPICASEVVGNSASVKKLSHWLKEWKKRWEKEQEQQESQQSVKNEDSDSDFELDNEERKALKKEDLDLFPRIAVLIGPHGSGKTASVYATAKEIQFKVFELNSSSQRSSKQISRLHEATQSHQVSKASAFNFFKVKNEGHSAESKVEGDSLILFKDVDVVFDDDKFFWSAIDALAAETKRPIVLTSSDGSILTNLEKKYEKMYFGPPSIDKQLTHLKHISDKEKCVILETALCEMKMAVSLFHCDLKKTLHALHFWGGGNQNTKAEEVKTAPPSAKKKRKGSRRKKKVVKHEVSPKEKEGSKLQDFFTKTAGIYDFFSKIEARKDEDNILHHFLNLLRSNKGYCEDLEAVENAVAHMISSRLPPVVKINWLSFMSCYNRLPLFTVGRTPLEISVPKTIVDSEREFTYEFPTDEVRVSADQGIISEFLIDEDSSDAPFEDKSSPTMTESKGPVKDTNDAVATATKTKLDKPTLKILSQTADAVCISDFIESTPFRVQRSNPESTLNVSRCKLKNGLLNIHSSGTEISQKMTELSAEIQAAIQVRSIALANSNLANLAADWDLMTYPSDEIPLRLPHEGKSRKSNQYLSSSIQSQCISGLLTTSRHFTTDFLPMFRQICRSEQVRKDAKKKRRFLHYFDRIRFFPKPSEMSRLLNDFKEVPQSP